MKRISVVKAVNIKSVSNSSLFQAGDNLVVAPYSRVFAVQREIPTYIGNEGNFNYPVFTAPVPVPFLDEQVQIAVRNANPLIEVGFLDIIGVSTSSVVQIGSNRAIQAENRTKHIRQLLPRERRTRSDVRP